LDAFARYYDVDAGLETEDIPFYLAMARRTGGPVLEVACGTGRVLLPLARAGFDVVGLDISPAMLAIAREKVASAGLQRKVRLVLGDARDFDLGQRFRFAFVALNSFMHLVDDEDQVRALRAIRRHLAPDGLLAIDLPNPETTLLGEASGQLIHEWTREAPDTGNQLLKLRSQRADTASQLLDLTFIYDEVAPDGQVRRTAIPFPLRYFHRREMLLLLEKCGFVVEAIYGSHELAEYEADSLKMIFVATPVPLTRV
jgi:SAM-dependent methyltransferase